MRAIIRWKFLIINIFFILCVVFALWGGSVSPERFLLPAYFILVLPVLLIINLLFVLFWIAFRKWYFLLSLVFLLITYPRTQAVFPINLRSMPTEFPEGSFSIMTYNTHAFGGAHRLASMDENRVVQHILERDPDIVVIQEFVSSARVPEEMAFEAFYRFPYRHIHYGNPRATVRWGVATFSKFPIVHREVVDIPALVNSAIFSDIVIGSDTIRLFNLHLESNRLTESDKTMPLELRENFSIDNLTQTTLHLSRKLGTAYRTRARQADIIAEEIRNSPHPVIVAGDLNDVPLSYVYRTVRGRMQDVFVSLGRGFGITFSEKIYHFRIDYIFCDENFIPLHFKRERVKYSDHYPLTAVLKIRR